MASARAQLHMQARWRGELVHAALCVLGTRLQQPLQHLLALGAQARAAGGGCRALACRASCRAAAEAPVRWDAHGVGAVQRGGAGRLHST